MYVYLTVYVMVGGLCAGMCMCVYILRIYAHIHLKHMSTYTLLSLRPAVMAPSATCAHAHGASKMLANDACESACVRACCKGLGRSPR